MKQNPALIGSRSSMRDAIRLIESSGLDEAFVISGDGGLVGGVRATSLRRLLLSGVDEGAAVGAFPPQHSICLRDKDLRDARRIEGIMAELTVSGFGFVPLVTDAGTIQKVLSARELSGRLSSAGSAVSPRTFLVVGGAGYLGSVLTRKLLGKGHHVRVLDSFLYGSRALDGIVAGGKLEVRHGDLRNIHTCVEALEGVQGVVLLAAIVGDPASAARPAEAMETNVLAAQALATACKWQHIGRFLYASTCSVYGAGAGLLDEHSPLNPVSLYARTKIASERIVLGLGDDYFRPTILRMGTLYGYSPRMRFDLVVNTMTLKAFTDGKISVFGGRQWRPLLNVEDAADAYVACLEADVTDVGNQVFNVGSSRQNHQIGDIARLISACLGGVVIEEEQTSLDARDYRVSFAKVEAALGFQPRHSIEYSAKQIYGKLADGVIRKPSQKIYYNHFFDSAEE